MIELLSDMEDLPGYTPQAISDIPPIYHPQGSDTHIRIYNLRQTSPNTQTLSLCGDLTALNTSYTIKSNKTGGFMNRKPHVIITADSDGKRVAEGRFDIHGTGTTISYVNSNMHRLELEDSLAQVLRTRMYNSDLWWQPHPGNKGVLELTNDMDEVVARFLHAAPVSQRTGSWPKRAGAVSPSKKDRSDFKLGELHVVGSSEAQESDYEQIVCSAIMVIERTRRRSANMMKSAVASNGAGNFGAGNFGTFMA